MQIGGYGLYVKGSVEAAALYCEAFGLTLGYHVLNEDGSYFHSELALNEKEGFAVVEAPAGAASADNPVQLGVTFDDRASLRRAYLLLREGGTVLMDICTLPWSPCAAEVVDRFGIRWYLTVPQHRPPDDFTPADCV